MPGSGCQSWAQPTRVVLRPAAVDDSGFTVEPDPDDPEGFVLRGERPERWVRQTNFDNDEAVGYLADRLKRLGVEEELAKRGAEPGSAVTIGDVTFDFEPAGGVAEEAAYLPTRRGYDERLDVSSRARAAKRLAAKRSRREPDPDGDEFG